MALFSVVNLAGTTVAELAAEPGDSVLALKRAIRQRLPSAAPQWQRLILGHTELEDQALVRDLPLEHEDRGVGGAVHLSLVLSVEASALLQEGSSALEAAESFDAMGGAVAAGHLAALFETEDGEALAAADTEDKFFSVAVRVESIFRRGPPLTELYLGLLPHAMDLLQRGDLLERKRLRMPRIFNFLGLVAVPRLVAWLGLLPRPVADPLEWRADALRQFSDFPRVRLAAKVALTDKGGMHLVRVKELGELRRSLCRYAEAGPLAEARVLSALRAEAEVELRSIQAEAASRHVQYAAERELR